MILPGDAIKIDDDRRRKLGSILQEMVAELEAQSADMFESIKKAWSLYEAEPAHERRTDPWDGASNIVVPVVRTAADAIVARYYNAIHATNKVWVGTSQNEEFKDRFIPDIPDFLNWGARNEFSLADHTLPWITEMVVVGESILQLGWESRERFIYVPGSGSKPTPQRVVFSRGPILRHVPREQILWDTAWPAGEAPIVARQVLMTPQDLALYTQTDDYDEDAVTRAKGVTMETDNSGSIPVIEQKYEREGMEADFSSYHDIREVWVLGPAVADRGVEIVNPKDADVDEALVPLLATLHMGTGELLALVAKPYFFPDWPFYDVYFRRRPGRGSSPGTARMLRDMQAGVTTMSNQAIDAVTLANSLTGFTTDGKLVSQKLRPGKMLKVDNMNDVTETKLSKQITPDMALIQMLNVMGERVSGVNDPLVGREARSGGHPAPATSTMALLQESSKMFALGIRSVRDKLSKLGMDIATLYQQYELDEDGKIERAIGPGDAATVKEFFFPTDEPIFGNLELDLHAISESMNPDTERNKALLVFQVTNNFFTVITQYLGIVDSPQAPPKMKQAALKAVEGLSKAFENILIHSDVDELEAFVFRLNEEVGTGGIEQFAGPGGGAGGATGAPEQPALGGGNGAAEALSGSGF